MQLGSDYVVRAEDPELLKRFQADPGVKPLVGGALTERALRMKPGSTLRRLQSLLRDLGWLVELDEA
ncbi:MAG: hypothetical protein IPJ19_01925 [Planctomycetes bacterium]|nr:hypothetical protein [Planctomycetota bacterium]